MESQTNLLPQAAKIELFKQFAQLPDPRVERTKLHSLLDIIAIAICAAISGAAGWTDVEAYGRSKEKMLSKLLELPNGIPSHDTFGRVFEKLDPLAFEGCFINWVQSLSQITGITTIAIDGKTLRQSYDTNSHTAALHLVSAWASERRLVLGQSQVEPGSNEITAIPQLLNMLALEGCLITIDAIGCQTEIAQQIVEQGADYVLAVKDNQPHLAEDISEIFALEFAQAVPFEGLQHDYAQTIEKNHGRIETRQCWTIAEPDFIHYIRNYQAWPALQTIALVRAKRQTPAGETIHDRLYISSLPVQAQFMLQASRQHWGIENCVHWVLDVVFGEDEARMRRGHMARNFALVRRIALNLLRLDTSSAKSIRAKRLKAAWDDQFLLNILSALN